MEKIIICFCEGQHDIAFLSRVLFVNDFIPYKNKIGDFVKPLNKQYTSILTKTEIADRKLGFYTDYRLPSVALYKEKTLALFHDLGGDKRVSERKKILDMYRNLRGDDDDFSPSLHFRFLYFFDADLNGIEQKIINT